MIFDFGSITCFHCHLLSLPAINTGEHIQLNLIETDWYSIYLSRGMEGRVDLMVGCKGKEKVKVVYNS